MSASKFSLIESTTERLNRLEAILASGGQPPHDGGMEARVAVLEEIAKTTKDVLIEIRGDLRDLRKEQASEFRWLLGLGIGATGFLILGYCGLFAVLARGFHWF